MNVLYQSDDNYAIFMGVSIYSLMYNNTDVKQLQIFVIDDDISEEHKQQLIAITKEFGRDIIFIPANQILEKEHAKEFLKYVGMRKNKHSFLKLFLGEVLPENVGRVVYIDCDTIVAGAIGELEDINIGNKVIGMCYDSLIYKAKTSIGFSLDDEYYNSGIILFDLNNWKNFGCEKRMIRHIREHGQYGTVDQDLLNVEFKNEIYTLPMKYNVQPIHLAHSIKSYFKNYKIENCYYDSSEIAEAVKNPAILHFLRYVGESPWNRNSVHPDVEAFDFYLQKTPWKDYQKKPANRGILFKIEKIMYKCLPREIFLYIFVQVHEHMIMRSNKK